MELDRIDQIARETMLNRSAHRSREPGWLYFHGHRTGKIAQWLANELHIDVAQDVLYVGALFHDVAKGQEPHNEIGAEQTSELLEPVCTTDEVMAICELVWKHNLRGNPAEVAAVKIVQDAGILDHVGAIEPWLSFYYSGSNSDAFAKHKKFVHSEENYQYRAGMRAMLNFELSIQEFDKRRRFEDEFFNTFHRVYEEGI